PVDRLEQGFASREVAIQRADANTSPSCNGLQARTRTACAEHKLGGLQHAFAITHRIGARPADGFCGWSCHLTNLDHDSMKPNRIMMSSLCLNMIFLENRLTVFITRRFSRLLRSGGCLRICQSPSRPKRARRERVRFHFDHSIDRSPA